jgi:uncharacterized protein YggE
MRTLFCFTLLLVASGAALAQLDNTTITISASRTVATPAPDQIVFTVSVATPYAAGVEDAVAAVAALGLTAADLSGIGTAYDDTNTPSGLQWNFTLAVPFAKTKETVAALSNLQVATAQKKNGKSISFYVGGLRVSPEAQASQTCSMTDLVADARARAQKLADAAGVSVGPILEVTPSGGGSIPTAAFGAVLNPVLGANQAITLISRQLIAPSPAATCAIVVKFRLLS